MIPFQIKICGVTRLEDAICVCQSGADAIGLNFYDRSSRYVDAATASSIVRLVDQHGRESRTAIKKIGVFVNSPLASIVDIAANYRLDGIQLHGDESPDTVSSLRSQLNGRGRGGKLIRAIRSDPAAGRGEIERVFSEISIWKTAGIDAVLLDAAIPGSFGGTGKMLDWNAVAAIECELPITLAGGLVPENVGRAITISKVLSVDVASGVESSPGIKAHDKVTAFVEAATQAFARVHR